MTQTIEEKFNRAKQDLRLAIERHGKTANPEVIDSLDSYIAILNEIGSPDLREWEIIRSEILQMKKADTKNCPFCAETIKLNAIVCRFCNRDQQLKPPDNESIMRKQLDAKECAGVLILIIGGVLAFLCATAPRTNQLTVSNDKTTYKTGKDREIPLQCARDHLEKCRDAYSQGRWVDAKHELNAAAYHAQQSGDQNAINAVTKMQNDFGH